MKEILLYSSMYNYTAANFINEMEANKGSDIRVRGNCPGGDMLACIGMLGKFQEHPKGKEIQVDGFAASMFALMLCYADKVTCYDASIFLFHRGAWGSLEDEKLMDDNQAKVVTALNAQARQAMESKCSSKAFEAVTGVSYDRLFSMEERIDVILNAEQAKKLGFVNEVIQLTPVKKKEIEALSTKYSIAAFAGENLPVTATTPLQSNNVKINKMNLEQFRAEHSALYNEVFALGEKAGVTKESERVKSLLVYQAADPERVFKAIKEGEEISPSMREELTLKLNSANALGELKTNAAAPANTPETKNPDPKKAAEENVEAFKTEAWKLLGIGEEKK